MKFSPLQLTGKVGDKVSDKVWYKFAAKSRTYPRLCRKLGVTEFGFNKTINDIITNKKILEIYFISLSAKNYYNSDRTATQ